MSKQVFVQIRFWLIVIMFVVHLLSTWTVVQDNNTIVFSQIYMTWKTFVDNGSANMDRLKGLTDAMNLSIDGMMRMSVVWIAPKLLIFTLAMVMKTTNAGDMDFGYTEFLAGLAGIAGWKDAGDAVVQEGPSLMMLTGEV